MMFNDNPACGALVKELPFLAASLKAVVSRCRCVCRQAQSRGSWGAKANHDLKHTAGKSFRHEKTKKKRGSYRGGNIDVGINSVAFDSDGN